MKIKLGDADRERLGAPEWLDCDLSHLSTDEAERLEETSGLEFHAAIGRSAKAWRLKVLLGLHRAGLDPRWDEVKFDLVDAEMALPSAGKAPSDSGDGDTSSTSATSSGTRRRRSASST